MELIYKHRWRKIWKLDDCHELIWEHGGHLDSKAWHIEKWSNGETFEARWGFSTKRDALKFWEQL